WIVKATVEGEPPITALITFGKDGGFSETAASPGVTSGHGNWERTANRQFALTARYLRTDANGQFVGTSKVRSTFVLDKEGTTLSGPFLTEVYDADGNLLSSFDGTATATPIQVERL